MTTSEPAARPDWTEYWLGVAVAISVRADCSRRRVGAVVVDAHQRIISTGYNGAPPGGPSCLKGECPRGTKTSEELPGFSQGNHDYVTGEYRCIAVHAEANALLFGDPTRMRGGTIYVSCEPCVPCRTLIQGMGLALVTGA